MDDEQWLAFILEALDRGWLASGNDTECVTIETTIDG